MNEETFIYLWNKLVEWNLNSKTLFDLNIDLFKHDKTLYDCIIQLLSLHYNEIQIDFLIWSIFDDDNVIFTDDEKLNKITIKTAEDCYEYIKKLEIIEDET